MTLNPFDLEAIHMLNMAGMPAATGDVALLAEDIKLVSDDLLEETKHEVDFDDDAHAAFEGMCELKRRIGGLGNLESYMKCLRVPARVAR